MYLPVGQRTNALDMASPVIVDVIGDVTQNRNK